MIFELSDDGEYYNAKLYHDFIEGDKTYEGYIGCKVNMPFFNEYKIDDEDDKIFEIIVADD